MRLAVLVLLCWALAGCSAHTAAHWGSHNAVSVHMTGGAGLAALVGMSVLLYPTEWGGSSRAVPDLDPDRRVSEQDCSKPIDFTLGNIRCK